MLTVNIEHNYPGFTLQIEQEIVMRGITGIFGPSGAGKSSLLRIIAGLERPDKGRLIFNNETLFDAREKLIIKAEQRNIGLIFQDSRLLPHLNVIENLTYAYRRAKSQKTAINDIVELTQLTPLLLRDVNGLSGGERQRVALARALLASPDLLLLDEPMSALDGGSKVAMLSMLLAVQQRFNIPMLYVSHSLAELQQVADRLIVMQQGCISHIGQIHQVIHQLNATELINQQTSLALPIAEHLPEFGLTRLALSENNSIYLPLIASISQKNTPQAPKTIAQDIRCFILASDISISLTLDTQSSIVNHLPAKITAVEKLKASALVSAECDGKLFYSQISLWSANRLALTVAQTIYLQFKASAVHTLTRIGT